MSRKKLSFPGSQGHALQAVLDLPAESPRAYALFAHCFTCSKDVHAANRISGALAENGIAVLRFDFTGLGQSEGAFEETHFTSNVGDLIAAADFLRKQYEAPQILIGHSLGGAAVLYAASEIPELKALVTINAPREPLHVSHHFKETLEDIREKGEAEVSIGGRPFRMRKSFIEDLEKYQGLDFFKGKHPALLIFHAPTDQTVSIDNAAEIFGLAKHPKSFVSLDGADHLLSRREDAAYVADVLQAWVSRFIGAESQESASVEDSESASVEGVMVESTESKFTQDISTGRHHLLADEPKSFGGNDLGPSPYDYLLAGLGACTSMTIRLYADHKKIPLKGVRVHLKIDKIHAQDCEDCETKEGKIDLIERTVVLKGDLTEEQRQGCLRIADKCPVHKTLTSEVKIQTRLEEE
ncbi:MAG: alpha/beta fold hydrolase [Alphaproteobacteria bacterium]|nr:alpha/beta fold hydrolase [Alphaproteobacteria bacterium]MBT5389984.1 alpha/beta fold hydrolase [Alphaproteobacteria bacterium]MBT5539982.1 alpha/beta fold hydrolase [Alphaproteobacteria bacterium]MBT5654156.1 alpha/beta fold hydrolase [Alphaproteobacteria bacterium]